MNIGLIGGGEKTNMVAETAWALLDFRYWENRHREKIIDFAKQLKPQAKGASVKFSVESSVPPMEKTKESWYLFLRAKEIASTLNLSLEAGKAGGGSDGSIAASLGVPTLDGLGPDGDGMHAETEHLLLPSLIQRTALLTRLLSQF
jgi:glutamate carboxypeptidase